MPQQAILFLIDTQGANYLGCYTGNKKFSTTNLDALAEQGVRFDQAYCCSPVCGPARSAIFTGLYPHSNGVLGNNQAPHLDLPTLGQRVSRADIASGYVGKWHLDGTDYFGNGRCPDGWDPDYWFDGRNYLDSLPNQATRDLSRTILGPEEVAKHEITAEFTHAHRIADRAIRFIQEHKEKDFLLVVSIDEPHHPFICPEPFVSSFEDFELEVENSDDPLENKPRVQKEWADQVALQKQELIRRDGKTYYKDPIYFGCNSFSDFEVGRVLDTIESETPDALTIYTADHGNAEQHHGISGKGPAMYDEIVRIPFIVKQRGLAPAGAVSQHPVSHIDIVPTLLDHFGIDQPDLLQGKSLLPQIEDPKHRLNEQVFIEFNRYEVDHDSFGSFAPIRCVCDGKRKLALNLLDVDEYYDQSSNPLEIENQIDSDPEKRDALHDVLLDWMDKTRDPLRGPDWARRPWRDVSKSSWGGPTRPRGFDEAFQPKTLLYVTGREPKSYVFKKGD